MVRCVCEIYGSTVRIMKIAKHYFSLIKMSHIHWSESKVKKMREWFNI